MTYDSWKEDTFNVFTNNGVVKFRRNNNGLYIYRPSEGYIQKVEAKNKMCNLMTTVNKNKVGYTKRQIKDAKMTRKVYHMMGCPMIQNFKHILRQNLIMNCPGYWTMLATEKIFELDIGTMKGKTTR